MATSVPTVIPLREFMYKLGEVLELAVEYTRMSGDFTHLNAMLEQVRWAYEHELKAAANLGKMDRARVNDIGKALEKMEERVAAAQAKYANQQVTK